MKQVKNIVTMSINKIPITVYTNATIWNNGKIMLGYDDPFASLGSQGAVYYSNLRVVRIGPPSITAVLSRNEAALRRRKLIGESGTKLAGWRSSPISNGCSVGCLFIISSQCRTDRPRDG